MRVVIAPDSFKGTHSAPEVTAAIAAGLGEVGVEATQLPVADGGEGTLDALSGPLGLRLIEVPAQNPWGEVHISLVGLTDDGTAVVEMAQSCGLHTPHSGERDPVLASTYGVGEHIAAAVAAGARRVIVATGGSATSDGGAGAVAALAEVDLAGVELTVLSDVTTTYVHAAEVFGPQKGASPEQVVELTERLQRLRAAAPKDPESVPGTGAAGGLSGGLWAHFDAEIVPGADFVLDLLGFDAAAAAADAVVTGEGQLDSQTAAGKIPDRVRARAGATPVYAIVGSVAADAVREGFAEVRVASTIEDLYAAGVWLGQQLRGR